ncbi:hypothetical protein V6N13_062206 [Hibiscus sabdariffa]
MFFECVSDTLGFESTPLEERKTTAEKVAEEDDWRSSASTTTTSSSSIGRNSDDDVSGRSSDGGGFAYEERNLEFLQRQIKVVHKFSRCLLRPIDQRNSEA